MWKRSACSCLLSARTPAQAVLSGAHLPTGYVALQDLIQLAIEEFAVTPRRRDWARVLEKTRQ